MNGSLPAVYAAQQDYIAKTAKWARLKADLIAWDADPAPEIDRLGPMHDTLKTNTDKALSAAHEAAFTLAETVRRGRPQ